MLFVVDVVLHPNELHDLEYTCKGVLLAPVTFTWSGEIILFPPSFCTIYDPLEAEAYTVPGLEHGLDDNFLYSTVPK